MTRQISDYLESLDLFEAAVSRVEPDQWEQPALGEWTVRQLVGHLTSSIVPVIELVSGPASRHASDGTTLDWFMAVLANPALDELVAEDGVLRGAELGDEPAKRVVELVEEARVVLGNRTSDRVVIDTVAGPYPLDAFLGTRIVELVLHTLDLSDALELQQSAPLSDALTDACLGTLTGLLRQRGSGADALRLLSGRSPVGGPLNALAPIAVKSD